MTPRRRDATGRLRYHGSGKRGRQNVRTAAVDIDHAIEALARAREALAGVPTAREDRRTRERLLAEARDHAELAQRFVRAAVRGALGGRRKRARPAVINLQIRLPL